MSNSVISESFLKRATTPLVVTALFLATLILPPLFLEQRWLSLGFMICAAAVAAIGLNLLSGTAGLLSLGHAFFLAAGALTYTIVSSEPSVSAGENLVGLGLPPILGLIAGVAVAGILGFAFSPISRRLRGIYLGIATIALVFIGLHVLNSAVGLSGGFVGRPVPAFELFGLSFTNRSGVTLFGVPFGRAELLWIVGLVVVLGAYLFGKNLLRSRTGRALRISAESELAAAVMGIDVRAYKGKIFFISSLYAGMAGVLYALSIGSISPAAFSFNVSLQYLVMIVIGGFGSVGGSIVGAAVVIALPVILQEIAIVLPWITPEALSASQIANLIYGITVILVLLLRPAGIASIWNALLDAVRGWFKNKEALN